MKPDESAGGELAQSVETQKSRTGLVTLLFTDIVGSTSFKQQWGDRVSASLFDQHHQHADPVVLEFISDGHSNGARTPGGH